jgi:ArsR family transcriptional regulator
MLARLREEDFVKTRRAGKTIYYSLANENTSEVIALLYRLFCKTPDGPGADAMPPS